MCPLRFSLSTYTSEDIFHFSVSLSDNIQLTILNHSHIQTSNLFKMGYYDPIPISPISPTDDQAQNWPLIARTITDEVVQIPIPPPAAKSRPNFFLRRAKTFRSFFSRRRPSKVNVVAAAAAAQTINGQTTVVVKPILKPAPKPAPKPAALKPAIKPYRQASTKSKRKSMAHTSSRASKRMTRVMSMNVQDLAVTLAAPPPPPPPPPSEHGHHNSNKHQSMYESFDNYSFAANMKRASVMVVGTPSVMF